MSDGDRSTEEMKAYYRRRAAAYEAIYHRPDAQRLFEQEELARAIRSHFKNREVLEIAAGTGWWTLQAAAVAKHVTATDANCEPLELAKMKPIPSDRVTFQIADAYQLSDLGRRFDGFLACCWLSHVRRRDLARFVAGMHAVLDRGAAIFLADNVFVAGLGGDLVAPPDEIDSYKWRSLEDGSSHLVLKNYFAADELRGLFEPFAADFQLHLGQHFWWLRYRLKA